MFTQRLLVNLAGVWLVTGLQREQLIPGIGIVVALMLREHMASVRF